MQKIKNIISLLLACAQNVCEVTLYSGVFLVTSKMSDLFLYELKKIRSFRKS